MYVCGLCMWCVGYMGVVLMCVCGVVCGCTVYMCVCIQRVYIVYGAISVRFHLITSALSFTFNGAVKKQMSTEYI